MSAWLCGFVVAAGLAYAAVTRVDGTLRGLSSFRDYAEQRKALEAERLQADADSAKAWKWLDDRGFVMDSWEDVKAACEDHGKSTRGVAKTLQEVASRNPTVGERFHGNAERLTTLVNDAKATPIPNGGQQAKALLRTARITRQIVEGKREAQGLPRRGIFDGAEALIKANMK